MPIYQRQDRAKLLSDITSGSISPIYLLFGERYLCREVSDELIAHLLPDEKQRTVNLKKIDGEQEDVSRTVGHLKTFSLFPGRQVIRVLDSKLFFSKAVARTFWDKAKKEALDNKPEKAGQLLLKMMSAAGLEPGESLQDLSAAQWKKIFDFPRPADISWCPEIVVQQQHSAQKSADGASLVMETLDKGIPATNVLILVAEAVDKRKKLYKKIGEIGSIIDLSIDSGATSAARKGQDALIRELIVKTFGEMGKKAGPQVIESLITRVGFHPVAAVREAEKLALFVGKEQIISRDDVEAIIGQTREDALYELNDAVAGADLSRSLVLVARLQESGIHSLALIAALRNLLRRLLFFRSLRERKEPRYIPGISYGVFQKGYLEELKKTEHQGSTFLSSHPFVLYKTFQQTDNFDLPTLKKALSQLLDAEFQLKSSALPARLVLEKFLFSLLLNEGGHSPLAS